MALQAEMLQNDVALNGNLYFNFGQIVLMNDPSMFTLKDNLSNDNAVLLEPLTDKNMSLNFEDLNTIQTTGCFPMDHVADFSEVSKTSDITFHYYNEFNDTDVYKGMKMLPIICNNTPRDQPEFVDVNSLTDSILSEAKSSAPTEDCITISDEDEVIFVGEYKGKEKCLEPNLSRRNAKKQSGIRRNPVRKARNSRVAGDLSNELLFEEDFAFLDDSDEDSMECSKKPSPSYKSWPVNAHERPEYNVVTKKLESLDYSIRNNTQSLVPKKKPRLETVRVTRKSKKRYFTRKRKARVPVVEKVPIIDLVPLVKTTSEMLKDFLKLSDEYRALLCNKTDKETNKQGKLTLESNQNSLVSLIVNGSTAKLKE